MSSTALLQTPLYDWHAQHNGRLVDFGGWEMPVQYTSIVEEHHTCRKAAAIFDVSHMGRFRFDGDGAEGFLDSICTRRVTGAKVGDVRYSLICNEQGGILDDVLVYHLAEANGSPYFWMVVNASNREKIAAWVEQHLPHAKGEVKFVDQTFDTAMVALQGPQAMAKARSLVAVDLASMGYYTGQACECVGHTAMVSRTGYTGEDGVELTLPADAAVKLWECLLDEGALPAGLAARDTLRLEAAMPLYGHELSETITPWQAGLKFAVNLKDRDFIGRDALAAAKDNAETPVRVGLEMVGRRVPREHCAVLAGDDTIGEVTSGTFSPTFEKPIAMAYVSPDHANVGTELVIDIRGRQEPAKVVKLPFYTRTS